MLVVQIFLRWTVPMFSFAGFSGFCELGRFTRVRLKANLEEVQIGNPKSCPGFIFALIYVIQPRLIRRGH